MSIVPFEAAEPFFTAQDGCSFPMDQVRRPLTAKDVTPSDEGLQQLAALGSWNEVVAVAQGLETHYTGLPERFMRYHLVRVTALLKLNRIDTAKQLIDNLGDVNNDPRFINVATRNNIVPFSLRFLRAVVPQYAKQHSLAQGRLYELLTICEQQQKRTDIPADEVQRWGQRILRVKRALVCNHFELQQFPASLALLKEIAESSQEHGQRLILLQEVGCLALRCGNASLAKEMFGRVDQYAPSNAQEATVEFLALRSFLSDLNRAFIFTFYGKYGEAAAVFSRLMMFPPEGDPRRTVPEQLFVHAANSFVVCHPYACSGGETDKHCIANAVKRFEECVRRNPKLMLAIDASVFNVSTLYNLAGDDAPSKLDLMATVTEVFRCDREAIPGPLHQKTPFTG